MDVPCRVDSLPHVRSNGKLPLSVACRIFVFFDRCAVAKKGAKYWLPLYILS